MILIKKRSAIKIFYYLMAVDGDVSADELNCFDEIGHEIDPESFAVYREAAIKECENQLKNTIDDDDYYEVVLERTDQELAEKTDDPSSGVSSRLLVWDLLVIAFSNDNYAEFERKFIKHIVRTMGVDHSVFLEMEQLMKTNISVKKEQAWIKTTNRTYAEVAPIVTELENRRTVIMTCAKALIEDEYFSSVEKVSIPQSNILENARAKFEEKVAPTAAEIGEKTTKLAGSAKALLGEATTPVAAELGKQTKKLFNGIMSRKKNGENENSDVMDGSAQVSENLMQNDRRF